MTEPTPLPAGLSRAMHELVETVHVALYLTPDPRQEYAALGLPAGYTGYVAARCAPLGPVGPEVAVATFYVFAPGLIRECLPSAWTIADPEEVLAARERGLDAGLRRVLDGLVDSPAVEEAADLLRQACSALQPAGRVLYAGHATLAAPGAPHLALWHWSTLLREHRGDGHVAALLLASLDPVEALVLHAATGGDKAFLQSRRGWSSEDWAAAQARLDDRGLVGASGTATPDGRRLRSLVEAQTDDASEPGWRAIGPAGCRRLEELLRPVVAAVRAADVDSGVTRRVGLRHG